MKSYLKIINENFRNSEKIKKSDILVSEKVKKKIEDRGLYIDEVLDKIFDLDNLIVEATK